MKQLLLVFLLILSLFLVSCNGEPSRVSIDKATTLTPSDSAESESDAPMIAVNISSKTIHASDECLHVVNARQDNLRRIPYSDDAMHTLISMEYSFCKKCTSIQ